MFKIVFKEEDKKEIAKNITNNNNKILRKKFLVLYLFMNNQTVSKIAADLNISKSAIRIYLKEYRDGGLKKIKIVQHYKPVSNLDEHFDVLKEYFIKNPPSTSKEAMAEIEKLTGIKRSCTTIKKF